MGVQPQLLVPWSDRRREFGAALGVLRTTLPVPPDQGAFTAFRAELLGARWPRRALALSAALHALFVFVPLPGFLTRAPQVPAGLRAARIEYDLRWTGARLLPPIAPPRHTQKKISVSGKKAPPPRRGADVQQAQTIISNPPEPNHPRQTLLTQFGLEKRVAPRDVHLPNMVIPPSPAAAPLAELDLRRLRAAATPTTTPLPPRPKKPLALAETKVENLSPKLAVEATSGGAATPAPEVGSAFSLAGAGEVTAPGIIALSAQPAPPRPVLELPEANLRARFSTGPHAEPGSPAGVPGGAPEVAGGPGGESGGAGSLSVPGVFVASAGPVPPGPVVVGPTGANSSPSPMAGAPATKPDLRALARRESPDDKDIERRAEEMIEGLAPGSRPRGGRRVYTLLINLPNLTSQTGSWVLRFAELGEAGATAAGGAADFALEAPVAVKKVDPRYPGEARRQRLEGVVFLYGIIREDGSVDSVRVVRSVHELLDANAVAAFERWRFEPGRKNGVPVALEVVVEIPFRLTRLF